MTSLIFPILDYCCLVYNDLSDKLNTKLQQLINCGIRFIFDLRRDVHISPYRRSLGWLTVRSHRLYFLGIATFNILQGSSPTYLRDLFTRSPLSFRPLRQLNQNVFAIPNFRTSTFRNLFYLSAMLNARPTIFVSEFWVCCRVLGLFQTFHAHTTMLNAHPTIFCYRVLSLLSSFSFVWIHLTRCTEKKLNFSIPILISDFSRQMRYCWNRHYSYIMNIVFLNNLVQK